MAFPIIPSGMFSGQGSTAAPNASANGTMSAAIQGKKNTNLAYAYDADAINTFAELYNTGLASQTSGAQKQEAIYTHSPATGLLSGSFLYLTLKVRANIAMGGPPPLSLPNISLVATLTGNYSDTTPIQSSSNPYTIISATGSEIISALGSSSKSFSRAFTGTVQIPFDQFAPLTIDIYSLSLSIAWNFDGAALWNALGVNTTIDARVYDISYIYL